LQYSFTVAVSSWKLHWDDDCSPAGSQGSFAIDVTGQVAASASTYNSSVGAVQP